MSSLSSTLGGAAGDSSLAWVFSIFVFYLMTTLHSAADQYYSLPLTSPMYDMMPAPSTILAAVELGTAHMLPTPYKNGFLLSGAWGLWNNLTAYQNHGEIFVLIVAAIIVAVGMVYAKMTNSATVFADHFRYRW